MSRSVLPRAMAPGAPVEWRRPALHLLALALAIAAVLTGASGGGPGQALLAAALATSSAYAVGSATGERATARLDMLILAVSAGLIAWAVDPAMRVWQAPPTWAEALAMSPVGGGLGLVLLLGGNVASGLARGRPLGWREAAALFLLPFLFTSLFLLSSAHLLADIGRYVGVGRWFGWYGEATFGRIVLLFLFNEIAIVGGGWLIDGHWTRSWRLRALLLLSAVAASLTPQIASLGAGPHVADLPRIVLVVLLPLISAAALAGLWAQTFLLTGLMLDAMHGRRPTVSASVRHWREGAVKGAIYSFVFMLLVQLAGLAQTPLLWPVVSAAPALTALVAGTLLYPLGRTLIESFDGSAPFFRRLRANAAERGGYLRGLVVGCGLALAILVDLPSFDGWFRFLFGAAVGALAYAGVDIARDLLAVRDGERHRLQLWRVYALGGFLGGIAAGAVAWYLDTSQVAVVAAKLQAYATVYSPAGDYIVYPLFSKWGALSLGPAEGGVRLLYNESLSGVINWSLAAPLFSINLVFLTALLQRSTGPIRMLFSAQGLIGLVEQAIRVLRWGLWMAPVIYSFLRMAPDPTWYDQDGAVRTGVATLKSWTLSPEDFRAWSLQLFLGLLAYDWFRVLIWFDHMGLRVATLVNLSFVGGDLADEKAARWIGHSGRARCVPDGLRRFATWAPLLIPFYIPRGAEWDQVWGEAERMQASAPSLLPPVADVLLGYAVCIGAAVLVLTFMRLRGRDGAAATAIPAAPVAWSPDRRHTIGNGSYTLEFTADGRSFARSQRAGDQPPELDLTRRSDDRLQLCGKFVYLRDLDAGGDGPWWSLGWQPVRHAGATFALEQSTPTSLRLANDRDGIRAEATVAVMPEETVELWRIRLANDSDRPRVVELVTYQELAIAPWDSYRRTPAYNALHVGTCFVRGLGAILARNRHYKPRRAARGGYPFAREVAFHAAGGADGSAVALTGYQDARPCFIGTGTLEAPQGPAADRMRDPADEGLLYSFDPIASLRLRVELPARGTAELRLVDGYAGDETEAAAMIARHLQRPPPPAGEVSALFDRARVLDSSLRTDPAAPLPFRYAADGRELIITGTTPRPWHHVLANPLGQGAVAQDDGEVFSFAGNAQQNGLTPCNLDTVSAQVPASAVYVMDLESGRIDSPSLAPQRHADAAYETVFGHGHVTYTMQREGLELELVLFVPPDEPLEIRLLTIRNRTGKARRFRIAPYFEMALAEVARDTRGRLQVRTNSFRKAYYFANPRNDFRQGWAFVVTSLAVEQQEHVRDRFLGGPDRDFSDPHFVTHGRPDPSAGDDGRRIAAFCGTVEVAAHGEAAVAITLGQAPDLPAAEHYAERHAALAVAQHALIETHRFWNSTLGDLRVETSQPAFDRLVNDWLPYQLLTARLWGRCGPSQRGGAFGFRDQLQDVLPLFAIRPDLARRQILLHARQQFLAGDVLQWWHPAATGGTGLGARNNASDPHLWLPYLTARYVIQTGDAAILEEPVPFLEGPEIPAGAEGINFVPRPSQEEASLYQHCCKAIDFTLGRIGPHGLPLIGSGDWNDGLSEGGSGESVWLGFFLYDTLAHFATLAERREGLAKAAIYRERAEQIRLRLDGMWHDDRYPRLVADNGDAISWFDALMGSWPVLSGAVGFERGRETVEAALAALEREHQVLLLTPYFGEHSPRVPGKIADYPPGVRENGGQYSHGSSWLVDALMDLADHARARGERTTAEELRHRAFTVWRKISPLDKTRPDLLDIYGLPPHQQPADIYYGPGYELRGGWSWYTGAAARMLTAAYAILGIKLEGGELVLDPDAFAPDRELRLLKVTYRGRDITP